MENEIIEPIGADEGYIRLACAIAETRAEKYKHAYEDYLLKVFFERNSISTGYSKPKYNAVLAAERKLKSPPTSIGDSEIRSLQSIVERASKEILWLKRMCLDYYYYVYSHTGKAEVAKRFGIHESILSRWVREYESSEEYLTDEFRNPPKRPS